MTRVLLTGADGQFGTDFQALHESDWEIVPLELARCDIRDLDQVRQAVAAARPAFVIHAAAWTDVDGAEKDPDQAFAVNALGSRNVAVAAEEAGAWLVALSTDYVFSGRQARPYHEFDEPGPVNVYGQSKLAGERAVAEFCRRHTIVRTAWLYGRTGTNFPSRILRLARDKAARGEALRVVNDQWGNPTSTAALAGLIHGLLRDPLPGVVHGSCEGAATWFEFARQVLDALAVPVRLEPCPTADVPRPAARPKNAALDKLVLRLEGRAPMPHWLDALQSWLSEIRHA